MEKISIKNFGGFKDIDFELNSINVIIGPQASGKSISVKLLFFFKSFFTSLVGIVENGTAEKKIKEDQISKFINYFPTNTWGDGHFSIQYFSGSIWLKVERGTEVGINFTYSENLAQMIRSEIERVKEIENNLFDDTTNILGNDGGILRSVRDGSLERFNDSLTKELYQKPRYSNFFIPAGRSFFATVQKNIFSLLNGNITLDPFIIMFGSFYEMIKASYPGTIDIDEKLITFDRIAKAILNGTYQRESGEDFLLHDDGRKINLFSASSGQQEILPLILILRSFCSSSSLILYRDATLYIEEPEAHLFPTAQKKIVELLARAFNNEKNNLQIIITTHSPYILSSFNNLLEGGNIIKEDASKAKKVHEVISKEEILNIKDLAVYSVFDGMKTDLIDKEVNLISDNLLDGVSEDIATKFGQLLDF